MIILLNNCVKRGELNNVSIILNGFENKVKYGFVYGYGYYGGYGVYLNGYYEEEKEVGFFKNIFKIFKK